MKEKEKREIRRRESGVHEFRGYDECQWQDIVDALKAEGRSATREESIVKALKELDAKGGER